MGRGGGGGGGGHSSGGSFGGGHHSSGGRMGGGGSRGSSGGSFGGSRGSSGGGFGGPRPGGGFGGPRPGGGFGGPRPGGGFGWGGGPRRGGYGPGPGPGIGCCSSIILAPFIFFFVVFALIVSLGSCDAFSNFGDSSGSGGGITASTITRTPLDSSAVNETGYYTDELGWIKDPSVLESGMKHFYQKTGVQPYLYITDTVNGTKNPTEDDMETYSEELYKKLFTDEGHIILLFRQEDEDYNNYDMWYTCGSQAKIVIDDEAADILMDYVDYFYLDDDLSESEMFSDAFSYAADRIMTVSSDSGSGIGFGKIVMIIIGVLVIIAALVLFVKKRKEKKKKEAEERQKVMDTPLDKYEDESLNDLKDKYKDVTDEIKQ